MVRIVEVVPYNPDWPQQFSQESARLQEIIGPNVVAMHHIGSTAIPGLSAKPTIDILIEVKSFEALDVCDQDIIEIGYQSKGENGVEGRRYFQKLDGERHLYHLHAFQAGHPEVERHLNFRDYLRAHKDEARAYQDLKVHLSGVFRYAAPEYTSAKTGFINAVNQKAAAWRRGCDGPQHDPRG